MSEDTLIEDLVSAGLSADLVGRVARVLVLLGKARNSAEVTEERRKRDRERKSKKSVETKEIAKANDVAIVGGIPRNSAESGLVRATHLLTKLSFSDSSLEKTESKEEYAEARNTKRGTRLPPDWQLTDRDVAYADQHGLVGKRLQSAAEEFIDYWIAVPGQRGLKLDWSATWRRQVRHIMGGVNGKHRQGTLTDLCHDLAGEARELERKAGLQRPAEPVRSD